MSLAFGHLRQAKANNIRTDGNRNKLFSLNHEGHGRCLVFPIGGKMPHGLSVPFIEGDKISARVAIEYQPARRHDAPRRAGYAERGKVGTLQARMRADFRTVAQRHLPANRP